MRWDSGMPSRVMRLSAAQPTLASVFWAGRVRARRPRPMMALYLDMAVSPSDRRLEFGRTPFRRFVRSLSQPHVSFGSTRAAPRPDSSLPVSPRLRQRPTRLGRYWTARNPSRYLTIPQEPHQRAGMSRGDHPGLPRHPCPARTGRAAHYLWTMHLDHRLAIALALAIGILVVTISAAVLSAMM